MKSVSTIELLEQARRGDEAALGTLLERYRGYLRLLAQRRLGGRLQARLDPSDVVQQTFLEAQRDLASFRGSSEQALLAWLLRILDHNTAQAIQRHLLAQKRDARREQSPAGDSGALPRFEAVAAEQSSPSQRAMRGEQAVRLAAALMTLPEDQCEAIRLRHLEGLTVKQLAAHFGRSEVAVAGLLKRGLRTLRQRLAEHGDSGLPAVS